MPPIIIDQEKARKTALDKSTNEKIEQFLPKILKNDTHNAILLTTIPAALYAIAAYGSLAVEGYSLGIRILIAVIFATLEYIVRVPINMYSANAGKMSYGYMQVVWIILTLILAVAIGVIFGK